jgi:hypothetical protein
MALYVGDKTFEEMRLNGRSLGHRGIDLEEDNEASAPLLSFAFIHGGDQFCPTTHFLL